MLVHRLLVDDHPWFTEEIAFSARRRMRVLNMSDFRDKAHSNSRGHAGFVRLCAMYLAEKVESEACERIFDVVDDERKFDEGREDRVDFGYGMPWRSRCIDDLNDYPSGEEQKKEAATPVKEVKTERIVKKLNQLLRILDRVVARKPAGTAKNSRLVLGKHSHQMENLTLVELASNLSKQTATLGGGLDPQLLNGLYDQGAVRQHVSTAQLSDGSASSVSLPGAGKSTTPVLALPAPDGTVQPVGNQDPFAASLAVPSPSYVQIAEMERKQQLLVQEQQLWQHYGRDGMQGQLALAKIGDASVYYGPSPQTQTMIMPCGMPQVAGSGHSGGYHQTPY